MTSGIRTRRGFTDGLGLLVVSRRLGHESIGVTADVYGHLLSENDDKVRAAIGGRVAQLKPLDNATVEQLPAAA